MAQQDYFTNPNAMTRENFNFKKYIDENEGLGQGKNRYGAEDQERAWADYMSKNPGGSTPAATAQQVAAAKQGVGSSSQIVPGAANAAQGEINVTDAAAELVNDPSKLIGGDTSLQEQAAKSQMTGTEAGTNVDPNAEKYQMDTDALSQDAAQADTSTAANVDPREATGYDPELVADKVAGEDMEAAQGEVSQEAIINAPQIDTEAIAKAEDAGGVGQALTEYASQNFDEVDKRATAKGQLEMLQEDFVDPITGEPKIPIWAQGTARSVGKIIAFTGQSGSAATAAMATAIMEASIPVATQDATFYQTLTIKNLDNKQAQILNRANVLANMEMANQDARVTAAIENSKNFLQMDLANLSNEQQAAVINNQNRVNAILEDGKQINAQRLFEAQSQNEMDMFYDNLNSQINQFNASQANAMAQYNTSEVNGMKKFNADMENQREQFYQTMQYNIDIANAKWRQTVTLTEDAQAFEAAATDVKNMVDISTEQLNRLWDRSDSLLEYAWTSSEKEADRKASMAMAKYQTAQAGKAGKGQVVGSIIGTVGSKIVDALF